MAFNNMVKTIKKNVHTLKTNRVLLGKKDVKFQYKRSYNCLSWLANVFFLNEYKLSILKYTFKGNHCHQKNILLKL